MKRRVIDQWEIGHFFGALVMRGRIDGVRVTRLFRWWSYDRFGLSSDSDRWVDDVVAVGRPAPTAFEHLEG